MNFAGKLRWSPAAATESARDIHAFATTVRRWWVTRRRGLKDRRHHPPERRDAIAVTADVPSPRM